MEKKCAICNSINNSDSLYCKNCGHFLYDSSVSEHRLKSIWEIDMETEKTTTGNDPSDQTAGAYISSCSKTDTKSNSIADSTAHPTNQAGKTCEPSFIICPACASHEPLLNGQKPLFCSACNYIFQENDHPVSMVSSTKSTIIKPPAAKKMVKRHGPLRSSKEDHSLLYFIGFQSSPAFVLKIQEEEEILGSNGNITPEILRNGLKPHQLKATHSPAGWYLQALGGVNTWNGDSLQNGMSRKLTDGDFITTGNCVMRVEILNNMPNVNLSFSGLENFSDPHSSLRLIGTANAQSITWNAKPEGSIFINGSAAGHLQIWYSANDQWHIRAIGTMVLLNGEELNQGFEHPLYNGDQINMGKYILQAEIIEKFGGGEQ